MRPGLTLDYGLRIAYAEPMYDGLGLSSNFLPDRWQPSQAPRLYVAGCANNVYPCTGANRQAMRSGHRADSSASNSILAIGTLVPKHRHAHERRVPAGPGHREDAVQLGHGHLAARGCRVGCER